MNNEVEATGFLAGWARLERLEPRRAPHSGHAVKLLAKTLSAGRGLCLSQQSIGMPVGAVLRSRHRDVAAGGLSIRMVAGHSELIAVE